MDNGTRLKKLLGEHGYSMTTQRLRIFEALQKKNEPIMITQLAAQLKDVDKVSVYRTVELFGKIGIIHQVWTGFKSKIELSEQFSPHHHHFTCLVCDKTIGINSNQLEKDLQEFEKEYGFRLMQHSVELSGQCKDCLDTSK